MTNQVDQGSNQVAPQLQQGKRLTSPTAIEFSEMHIIHECLKEAGHAFELYFALLAQGEEASEQDITIRRALFRDGLVQIMACFNTNPAKRPNFLIPSEVYSGLEGWEEFYNWMKDYRDAFAAHNFGPKRLGEAIAFFNSETHEFIAISGATMMTQGEGLEAQHSIRQFWRAAVKHVKGRIDGLSTRLTEEVKQLKPADIAALEPAKLVVPGVEDIRTSREKYRNKSRP